MDYLAPHWDFISSFHGRKQRTLLDVLLTCILKDVTFSRAFPRDQSEVVLGSFGEKLNILTLSNSAGEVDWLRIQ